jgi:hypothetical protein
MTRIARAALVVSLVAALAACQRSETKTTAPAAPPPTAAPPPAAPAPVAVLSVDTGTGIAADHTISTSTTVFAPTDTIYASVKTTGAASAPRTLAARWTYEDGQVVKEDSQSIQPAGPAQHSFSIAKPDGWPTGKYKVEITLDGKVAGSREIEVK